MALNAKTLASNLLIWQVEGQANCDLKMLDIGTPSDSNFCKVLGDRSVLPRGHHHERDI